VGLMADINNLLSSIAAVGSNTTFAGTPVSSAKNTPSLSAPTLNYSSTTSSSASSPNYSSIISQAQSDWAAANARGDQAGMDAAHAQAEAARNAQGYSGGADGSQYYSLPSYSYGSSGGSSSGGSYNYSFPSNNISYDPNKDYTQAINDARARNDYTSLAQLERERNAKIQGMGLDYQTTNLYQNFASNPNDWKYNAASIDPWNIRSIYSNFGGDIGQAAQYLIQSGQYDQALQAINDRSAIGGNDNDELQQALNDWAYRYSEQTKQDQYWQDYMAQQEAALQAQQAAVQAMIQQMTQQGVYNLEQQKTGVNSDAETAGKNAYLQYMKAKNQYGDLAENKSRIGSGGAGDYMTVAALNSYQGANADILNNRDKLLNDINVAINNAKMQGGYQLASAQSDAAQRNLQAAQYGLG